MTLLTRRAAMSGAFLLAVAACDNSVGSGAGETIDRRVANALSVMYQRYPDTRDLASRASGMLVMPTIGTAGFVFGGSYGEGALLIDGITVDYYSATEGSFGFQAGVKETSQVIFFLTPQALERFRRSPGWELGAEAATVFGEVGGTLSTDSQAINADVVSFIFDEKGLQGGVAFSGIKYSRILR